MPEVQVVFCFCSPGEIMEMVGFQTKQEQDTKKLCALAFNYVVFFQTYVPNGNGEVTGLFEDTPPIGYVKNIEVTFNRHKDASDIVISGLNFKLCGVIGKVIIITLHINETLTRSKE